MERIAPSTRLDFYLPSWSPRAGRPASSHPARPYPLSLARRRRFNRVQPGHDSDTVTLTVVGGPARPSRGNGFLADSSDSWKDSLKVLIESVEKRKAAGARAREDILRRHT